MYLLAKLNQNYIYGPAFQPPQGHPYHVDQAWEHVEMDLKEPEDAEALPLRLTWVGN